MNTNIRLRARIEDGLWTNSTPIKDPAGNSYTVVISREFDSAQILNAAGEELAGVTDSSTTADDMLQAIKNFLITDLGCVFAVNNSTPATKVVISGEEPPVLKIVWRLRYTPRPNFGEYSITDGQNTTDDIDANATSNDIRAALIASMDELAGIFMSGNAGNFFRIQDVPETTQLDIGFSNLHKRAEDALMTYAVPDAGTVTLQTQESPGDLVVIDFGDDADAIQTKIQAVMPSVTVNGDWLNGYNLLYVDMIAPEQFAIIASDLESLGEPLSPVIQALVPYEECTVTVIPE